MKMYRQGDILIIETQIQEYYLRDATYKEDGVVAEGSITGHHHVVKNGRVFRQNRDWYGCIGYIQAEQDCVIVHDEHHTIELPAGEYKIIKQREVTGDVED